jgi:hypothetical protein
MLRHRLLHYPWLEQMLTPNSHSQRRLSGLSSSRWWKAYWYSGRSTRKFAPGSDRKI